MRLINAKTYVLEEFYDASIPSYAILSHTWETQEVSLKDMDNLEHAQAKRGFRKIEFVCAQARKDRLEYVWVDTCCIDKTSSAELQEAINSMFSWYEDAQYCYIYLSDILGSCPMLEDGRVGNLLAFVSTPASYFKTGFRSMIGLERYPEYTLPLLPSTDEQLFWHEAFSKSKWFTRGWTLQELIAPKIVSFFGCDWNYVGDRFTLTAAISKRTGIDPDILGGRRPLSSMSIAQKMSWAAGRKTTRIEDQAYSLLGLFGVNIPMLYGEGSKAYIRLQEEIMRHSNDQSIFAWSGCDMSNDGRLLAKSPAEFSNERKIVQCGWPDPFEMTNRGLRITVPVLDIKKQHGIERLAVLNCRFEDDPSNVLGLRLQSYRNWDAYHVASSNMGENDTPKGPGRLSVVNGKDLRYTKKDQIEITRTSGFDQRGPRLWLDLFYDARIIDVQVEGSRFPRSCWRMDNSVAYEATTNSEKLTYTSAIVDAYDDGGDSGGLGALFQHPITEERLFVAFGFDKRRQSYNDFESHVGQLGVWLIKPPRDVLISDLVKRFFTLGEMDISSQHGQPTREATLGLYRGWAVARATVALRKLLGEEAILCTVRLANSPVEIHSAMTNTDLQRSRVLS